MSDRVVVAMSGGVDSSVAAGLLREQGYDVVGVFMRLGGAAEVAPAGPARVELPLASADARRQGCCSAADASDARLVAGRLGIPFYALNFEREFGRLIDYFADEYAAARTPNPCVLCNQWLKFGRLLAYADAVEADFVATGHYARMERADGRPCLRRAADAAKDQSYVLFGIGEAAARRTLFPLGELTKAQVRAGARRLGLAVHDKPESQDICFAPDRDYARVVRLRRPDAFVGGDIRHVDGRRVGGHEGLPNFTIGQRRGVRVALGEPVYVTVLDAARRTVTVGPRQALLRETAEASDVSWWIDEPAEPVPAEVKIRYNHEPTPGWVEPLPGRRLRVRFDDAQPAVTPGQALVAYRGDAVLAGGWID